MKSSNPEHQSTFATLILKKLAKTAIPEYKCVVACEVTLKTNK